MASRRVEEGRPTDVAKMVNQGGEEKGLKPNQGVKPNSVPPAQKPPPPAGPGSVSKGT
jgi:hypothetical protein